MTELLPTRASFGLDDAVEIEVRGLAEATPVSLWHLDRKLDEAVATPDDPIVGFGRLDAGGYGVEGAGAQTALDVLADPLDRLRYGFVVDFRAGRDITGVADNVRRLHLNAVLFYDWMYRHAQLLPTDEVFEDALGRAVSLATVRDLTAALSEVGSLPMGYAAVYAAGREHRPEWEAEGLYHADGNPWTLGDDFLWNVDPSNERWVTHLAAELAAARAHVGFAGFHLDQFGAPKRAQRRDGSVVDLAVAFRVLIDRLHAELPGARLIFNNVNDYPTWSTAGAAQDATYVEVWSPHDRLDHLGALVTKAKALAPTRSVSLAAYLSVFDGDEAAAREAMCLELATVFSHGGTCLLHGEEDAVLVDPYYVRHHRMDGSTAEEARRYYDLAVRYGDLLFDRTAVDVTRTHTGGINEEIRIGASVPVATDCVPGAIWARVLAGSSGTVVSLVDLSGQDEVGWNAPKRAGRPVAGTTIAFERSGRSAPRVFVASPDAPGLRRLQPDFDGRHDVVSLPPFRRWALVWVAEGP